jgi:DNA helicase-2/ATP-dependent DNA helicase PcrA
MSPAEYLWDFLMRSGMYAHYGAQPGGKLRQANLRMLCLRAGEYFAQHQEGMSGFLETVQQKLGGDETSPTVVNPWENVVRIMTIHKSKGLEFPTVYVVGMEEGIFPGNAAQYDMEELEEERRLCYVAMTRAKEKLTLTNAKQRMLYGRTTPNAASRFLEEIPEENMRWESKPQPRFGRGEDDIFGGDRWNDGSSFGSSYGGGYGGSYPSSRPSTKSSYGTKAAPLASSSRGTRPAAPGAGLMQLAKGDMIEHTAFGKGTVQSVRPMGGDALVEVAFDSAGTKKLMLKSAGAHLKKL